MKVIPGFGLCAKPTQLRFFQTWKSNRVEHGHSFCDLEVKVIQKVKAQFIYWLLNAKVEKPALCRLFWISGKKNSHEPFILTKPDIVDVYIMSIKYMTLRSRSSKSQRSDNVSIPINPFSNLVRYKCKALQLIL